MSISPVPTGRMLLSGITVAAGAAANFACFCAGLDPGTGILATNAIIGSLASLAGNSLATDAHTVLDRPVPDPDSRRWNHDILRASVLAVSDIIRKNAEDRNPATAASLRSLAQAVATYYDEIDDKEPLAVVTEAEVRGNLRKGESFQQEPSGYAGTWAAFLHHVSQNNPDLPNIPQEVMEDLGTAICQGFNSQLHQVLKCDFDAKGSPIKGRAYAAVTLDLLKHIAHGNDKILAAVENLEGKVDSIKGDTAATRKDVEEIRASVEEIKSLFARERDFMAKILSRANERAAAWENMSAAQRFELALDQIAAEQNIAPAKLRNLINLYVELVEADSDAAAEDKFFVLMRQQAYNEAAKLASGEAGNAKARMTRHASRKETAFEIAVEEERSEAAARARAVDFYLKEGMAQEAALKYEAALGSYREAATLDPKSWNALNSLGEVCHALALHGEEEVAFTAAMEIATGTEKEGESLSNLAIFLLTNNRLVEAEPLMRRALEVDEASLGKDNPDVALRLNNLAQLFQMTGRLTEAEPLMLRALEIDEAFFGRRHSNIARDLNNLAGLYQATNRLSDAESLMRRALDIDEASLGKNHPEVAIRLNNLAHLLRASGNLTEAEPLLHRALEIDELSFGDGHPNVARDLSNLASLFHATNRLSEAEPLIRRALEIDEAYFGWDHPKIAIRLKILGRLLQETDRLEESEPLMRKQVVIFSKFTVATGYNHPHLKAALGYYIDLLHTMEIKNPEFAENLATLGPEAGWEVKLKELIDSV